MLLKPNTDTTYNKVAIEGAKDLYKHCTRQTENRDYKCWQYVGGSHSGSTVNMQHDS